MDVSSVASLATNIAETGNSREVGIAVLKKAMDIESENAATLLKAIPAPQSSANLPPHLGQNVNTTA